jgi:hypothetical protein
VVIGETTEIGNRVRLYQGVTLGALSMPKEAVERFRDRKRHPTIEDDVIIYSNTTILGGDTVIGARSTIGGNVWITQSVPPDTKVYLKKPELVYSENGHKLSDKERDGCWMLKKSDTIVFCPQNCVRNPYTINFLILIQIINIADFDVWEPYRFRKSSFCISMPAAINFHSSVLFLKFFFPQIQILNAYPI